MPDVTTAAFSYGTTQDPVIKKFVDEVSDQMKVEIIQTLSAQKDPANFKLATAPRIKPDDGDEEDSVGSVVKQMYEGSKPAMKQQVLEKLTSPQVYNAKLRMDVSSSRIDLKAARYALDQVNVATRFNFANEQYLRSLANRVTAMLAQTQSNGSTATVAPNRKLNFKVHQVKCIDETGGAFAEFVSHDVIDMGGTSIDDKGSTTMIAPFRVDSSFDDNDVKVYNPAKVLRSFALDNTYPKNFSVFLAIAEKDEDGGFFSYLDKLFKAVRAEVATIVKKIADMIGRTLSAIFGGKLGEILYSLASLILSKLIDWITGWFTNYDDVFEPQIAAVGLRNGTATFNGSLTSSIRSFTYSGHGGQYLVRYSWELVR